ncbi:thiol-disulfide oxidoreductase DCC family protein [Halovenus rubra]|uniref:Thiol-disulfide oxidoreductase DCC family protein n=2 Tax=Halovenus rubra TaxID=869890 RepID=A0ACC7E110_9EURY|nr:thiol-disulfide oxidoreductase DCC family protein [Halovenus rubra]
MTEVPADQPVLLFDGVCNFCNYWVQFIIERDPDGILKFAPLQSDVARELLANCGLNQEHRDSVVLVEGETYYTKSDAVLRTANHLNGLYQFLWLLRVIPRRLRNYPYDVIAANRYDWFGKRDNCLVPTPDIRERFLGDVPSPSTADDQSNNR